jgi:hypothetical protein
MAALVDEVGKHSARTREDISPNALPKSVFSALHESGAMTQTDLRFSLEMLNQRTENDYVEAEHARSWGLREHRDTVLNFYHNFFARLFHRYRKYSERGIEFVGISTALHTAFLEMASGISLHRTQCHSDIGYLEECVGEAAAEYLMGEDASAHQGPGHMSHGGSKQGLVVCQEEVRGERAKAASRRVCQKLGVLPASEEVPQTARYTRYEMDVLGCEVMFH